VRTVSVGGFERRALCRCRARDAQPHDHDEQQEWQK
jgi:hypothetical protein